MAMMKLSGKITAPQVPFAEKDFYQVKTDLDGLVHLLVEVLEIQRERVQIIAALEKVLGKLNPKTSKEMRLVVRIVHQLQKMKVRIAKLEEAATVNRLGGSKKSDLNIGNVLRHYSMIQVELTVERETRRLSPATGREIGALVTTIDKLFSSMVTEAAHRKDFDENETNSKASMAATG